MIEYGIYDSKIQASWYPLAVIAIFVARVTMKAAIKKFGKTAVNKAVKKHGKKTSASHAVKKATFSRLDDHYEKHVKRKKSLVTSQKLNI